jgi:hypothetical protein
MSQTIISALQKEILLLPKLTQNVVTYILNGKFANTGRLQNL